MIVLDENVLESQRTKLLSSRGRICQIGDDVGRKGMQDDQIVVLLRTLRRPSFFSRDRDFFKKSLCSDQYSIVYLDVRQLEVAPYVRRFLRHPEFKTWSSRKGAVARVTAMGVFVWRPRASRALSFTWVK